MIRRAEQETNGPAVGSAVGLRLGSGRDLVAVDDEREFVVVSVVVRSE